MVRASPVRRRTVVVTRPLPEAGGWADHLRAAAYPVLTLPLINIQGLGGAPSQAHLTAVQAWPTFSSVMFVSANAVRFFFAAASATDSAHWLARWRAGAGPRCWATGPGTVKALRAAGVPEQAIDAPLAAGLAFDSENLWAVVQAQIKPASAGAPEPTVLIVRGRSGSADDGDGRDWLGKQCVARGAQVTYLAVYQRSMPVWDSAFESVWKQATSDPTAVWLVSSTQALSNAQALVGADSNLLANQTLLVTHARIQERAKALGCKHVALCAPVMDSILMTLRALDQNFSGL